MKKASRRRHRRVAIALPVLLLAACGGGSGNEAAPAGEAATPGPSGIATDYIKANGGPLDACFGPLPAIRGPGDIQTVADDQTPRQVAIDRLVIAIDASGSMAGRSGAETKMDAARRAAIAFLRSVPATTRVGLVAFGHRGTNLPAGKPASCRGVETIYPLGSDDPARIEATLNGVRPTGWTPLAAAIAQAGQSFAPGQTPGAQIVYVVSDGLETCGGDPVAAARTLARGPVKAIVNIIGFDLTAADRAQLSAVADAGGGSFVEVRAGGDVGRAMNELWRKVHSIKAMTTEYYDAGARIAANNMATGRYTTDLNFCVARTIGAESKGLGDALAAARVAGDDREAALTALRNRHDTYRARSSKVAADLLAKSTAANDAITAQQRDSEQRLGVRP